MQNRFKELRLERDLSLRDLGERIGLNYSTIACYETGKREPNIETLKKLTSFFEVSLDYICGEDKYIYALYENAKKTISITKESYDHLKPVIYFNDDNHRCIDINKYVDFTIEYDPNRKASVTEQTFSEGLGDQTQDVNKNTNIFDLVNEINVISNLEVLFDNRIHSIDEFDTIINQDVIVNVELLNKIKEIIK